MQHVNIYEDIGKSLLLFLKTFSDENQLTLDRIDFDAHAEADGLPSKDVIGIAGLSVAEDEKIYDVNVMFGISTYNDENLTRLRSAIGKLFQRLVTGNKVNLYSGFDGTNPIGFLVAQSGTRILPVNTNNSRPLQFVIVSFSSSAINL